MQHHYDPRYSRHRARMQGGLAEVLAQSLAAEFLPALAGAVAAAVQGLAAQVAALTLICEHSEKGTIGLVVNKPIDVTLGNLFEQVNIDLQDEALRFESIYFGGPVLIDRGFVLHQPLADWSSTLKIDDDTGLTTSKDILEAMAAGTGPSRLMVTLGYAGWAPGQLEDEIKRNGWLTVAAQANLIFDLPPEERLNAAMGLLGLNYGNLSDVAGHA